MFTKSETQNLRRELELLLKDFNHKHNVNVTLGNAKYGQTIDFNMNIQKNVMTDEGLFPKTKESIAYKRKCDIINLPVDALFKEFIHKGDKIRIMGYNSRASKMPINYFKNEEPYKCSPTVMRNMLKTSMPELFI